MLSKKQIIILISVLGSMLFTNNHVSAAYSGLCIGHNYEQQTPTPGIQEPTVHINGVTTIIEGSAIYLTANAFADEQQGGVKTFFWCTEKGKLEYDPDYQDGSGVKLTAPLVTGAGETVKVAVQVGDGLGYAAVDIISVKVLGQGDDPPPPPSNFRVPDDYNSVQDAVDAASQAGGGVVLLSEGIYHENITLPNGVWLKSETGDPANTIISGNGKHNVIKVNGIQTGGIIGLTIENSGSNGNFAGINCSGNDNPVIANCIIKNNRHGIVTGGASAPYIVNNVIADNSGTGIEQHGNGKAGIVNNIISNNLNVALNLC